MWVRVAGLFAALPAARDALGAAQELEQRDAVLAAEVHEFYVLHAVVEEHTCNSIEMVSAFNLNTYIPNYNRNEIPLINAQLKPLKVSLTTVASFCVESILRRDLAIVI